MFNLSLRSRMARGPQAALLAALVGCGSSAQHGTSSGSGGVAGTGAGSGSSAGAPSGLSSSGGTTGDATGATTGMPASGSSTGASGAGSTGVPGGGSGAQGAGASAGASGAGGGSGASTGAASGVAASGASAGSGATASGSSPASGQSSGASPGGASVLTQHNDLLRTGLNPNESILTPATVTVAHFGKTFTMPVDGQIYAQPLVVPHVAIAGMGTHDVVYIATENNSVYAFDAATKGAPLWHVNFNGPGITPVPAGDTNEGLIVPQIGITGTPVIDAASSTLYVVADTKITAGPSYERHLHALDLATGAEKLGGPVVVAGGVPGTAGDAVGGMVSISPLHGGQKAGLALSGGILYVPLAGHGDRWKYWHGWIFGYDAATLAQKFVWCSTPDANSGAIWQSAAGIPIDAAGNAFAETGNGTFDAMGGGRDFADSLVKVSAGGALVDWFAPHDAVALGNADQDLGSAGPILLPDQTGAHPHLAVATGKPGYLYVVDRDSMGHFNAAGDTQIVQKINVGASVFSTPVYFNGQFYVSPNGQSIKAFSVTAGQLSAAPVSQSARTFGMAFLSVSSNGAAGGIVWALQGSTLFAYDASDLTKELYDATQAPGGRDTPGPGGKFVVPTVANGRVYVPTQTEVDVYGAM